jgi:hypothetical protein
MKKIIDTFLKVLLSLLLLMPILGATGIFPAPTPDLYSNARAFEFIKIMMDTRYISIMMSVVFFLSLVCLWTKRTALAALLILPVTLNIIGFHAFMDSGLLTGGAVMGDVLFLLNIYFLWQNRETYKTLTKATA